ncbi:MAG TPA: ABC transporter substrate-binding protein [Anaerolineae bacterium]
MSRFFRDCSIFLSLVAGLFLFACAPSVPPTLLPERVKLKVLLLPYLSYAPLFIAQEEGYYNEQGLDVEFVRLADSATAIPSLAQGGLDVVGASLRAAALNAMLRGTKMRIVADKGHIDSKSCGYYSFIARRSLVEAGELQTAAQLKGRRLSNIAGQASPEGYFVDKLLGSAGLTFDDAQVSAIPLGAELEAMQQGALDLTVAGEPSATQFVQSGQGVKWMQVQQIVPGFQFDVLIYGPNLEEKNPDAGRRFMVAYLKAVRQYNQGKTARNLDLLTKFTGLDRGLVANMCLPSVDSDAGIDVNSVMEFQAWAVQKKFLDRALTPDEFWDPSFVQAARNVIDSKK